MATKPSNVLLAAAVVILLLCATAPWGADAATCDGRQLVAACAPTFAANSPPTAACCRVLKQEQRCLCRYARDASLQRYVTSPNGWKTLAACKVAAPSC